MIYKGTNYTERINFATYEGQKFWTELRKEPTTPKLEVFLCEDMGTSRNVWSWWFDITDPMTYEQIKLNVMEMMFEQTPYRSWLIPWKIPSPMGLKQSF